MDRAEGVLPSSFLLETLRFLGPVSSGSRTGSGVLQGMVP